MAEEIYDPPMVAQTLGLLGFLMVLLGFGLVWRMRLLGGSGRLGGALRSSGKEEGR